MNSMQGFDSLNDAFTLGLERVAEMLRGRADARTVAALLTQYNALVARSNVRAAQFNTLSADYNELVRKSNRLLDRVHELENKLG